MNRMNEDRDDTYADLFGDLADAAGDLVGVIPTDVLKRPEVQAELKKVTKTIMRGLRLTLKDLFE